MEPKSPGNPFQGQKWYHIFNQGKSSTDLCYEEVQRAVYTSNTQRVNTNQVIKFI